MYTEHTFNIPVMGTGYTIDTPIKVAKYGISSVISLVDDGLIEEMRKFYCQEYKEEYLPITQKDQDYRAKRITEYLNLVDRIVKKQFNDLKNSAFEIGSEITKYFDFLPETSSLKCLYHEMMSSGDSKKKANLQKKLRDCIAPGLIHVNIMTKLDRPYFGKDGKELPSEFSDAMAALRGFAQSSLQSAIVFSAGVNRKLYNYVAQFKDFYADAKGNIRKKIILKVSDYRSSFIQGKLFAQKGLWISEFRIESGLNCGGHAFPTDGYLMGPILDEFKNKKKELISTLHRVYNQALKLKNQIQFSKPHQLFITAQGGIGTSLEDQFLKTHYQLDATGWATHFLLAPDVTNVDKETLEILQESKSEDLYLSEVSPMGVRFSNIRKSQSDLAQERNVKDGSPGSACPKGHLRFNTEFTKQPICLASKTYQKLKIDQLKKLNLDPDELFAQTKIVIKKTCICHDLGEAARKKYGLNSPNEESNTAICPGPNMAYFKKITDLPEMVKHIYGRVNICQTQNRPHMFVSELKMYVDYLAGELRKSLPKPQSKEIQYFKKFRRNLLEGIEYYKKLITKLSEETQEFRTKMLEDLKYFKNRIENLFPPHLSSFEVNSNEDFETPKVETISLKMSDPTKTD